MDDLDDLAGTMAKVRRDLRTGRARAIREVAGMTQQEVAAEVRASRGSVLLWETGRRVPRGGAALRLARLLDRLEAVTCEKVPAA